MDPNVPVPDQPDVAGRLKRTAERDFWVYEAPKAPPLSGLFAGPKARARLRKYWVTDNIGNAADIFVHFALKALPIDVASDFGAWLGRVVMPRFYSVAARRAKATIAKLRPDLTPAEQHALYVRNCENQGRLMTEFSVVNRIARSKGRLTLHGGEHLRAARAKGPMVLVGMHLGNWELGPSILQGHGAQVYANYVPPKQRGRAWVANRVRTRAGLKFLPPGIGGLKDTYGVLRRGGVVSFFCDEGFQGVIRAPLFGRPPNLDCNMVAAIKLARATKASLCPWYTIRTHKARFDCVALPAVVLPPEGKPGERLAEDVLLVNSVIEPIVRQHLEQWYFLDNALPDQ